MEGKEEEMRCEGIEPRLLGGTEATGQNDVISPNPACRPRDLMLTSCSGTPKELRRLVGVKLETVGLRPVVYIVYACRQTQLQIMNGLRSA